jgi:hypothetical protein
MSRSSDTIVRTGSAMRARFLSGKLLEGGNQ